MATATLGPQGKVRAVESIRGLGVKQNSLRMRTFPATSSTGDPVMERTITWGTDPHYAKSTNTLPVKTSTANSEYEGALLFPIAAGRRFGDMTLHLSDEGGEKMLTFVLDGSMETRGISNYGTAKFVGEIKISF